MDLRYYKTNPYFLGILTVIVIIITFFILREKYPEDFNRNVPISIISGIMLATIIYYFPLKLPKSVEPFDESF